MTIVIDIPEEKYKALQKCQENNIGLGLLDKAVLDGMVVADDCEDVLGRVLEIIEKQIEAVAKNDYSPAYAFDCAYAAIKALKGEQE